MSIVLPFHDCGRSCSKRHHTLGQSTCWADCWAPGPRTDPSQCKSGLYPIALHKEINYFDIRNLFVEKGGGTFWGGKCYLTFAQVWMSMTLQRGFWWGFGTCWDTNMLYMYTTIYNYVTCYVCIHLRLYGMYVCICIYIYIYLPAIVIRLRPNSSSKFTHKRHEGSGGIKAYPWKCGTNPLAVDRSRLNSLGRIASRHCHWVHCHSRDILPDKHLFFMASAKKNNLKLETFNDLFAGSFH